MAEAITVQLNDENLKVPSGITVKKALQLSGHKITKFPEKGALFVPCGAGGCWSCAVLIDGKPKPACKTLVRNGLHINTSLTEKAKWNSVFSG